MDDTQGLVAILGKNIAFAHVIRTLTSGQRLGIKGDMTVFDTVYNPLETQLLEDAKDAGAKTIDGMTMFINQALAQFELFTGRDGSAELMRQIITSKLTP